MLVLQAWCTWVQEKPLQTGTAPGEAEQWDREHSSGSVSCNALWCKLQPQHLLSEQRAAPALPASPSSPASCSCHCKSGVLLRCLKGTSYIFPDSLDPFMLCALPIPDGSIIAAVTPSIPANFGCCWEGPWASFVLSRVGTTPSLRLGCRRSPARCFAFDI